MKEPTRQHYSLASEGKLTPEPGGAPTTDVFEGSPSCAPNGCVYGPGDGESTPAGKYMPGPGTSNKSNY